MKKDIRWEQRFQNFIKAFRKLQDSIIYLQQTPISTDTPDIPVAKEEILNEMIKEGLIKRFEYTHELAWNVMKDYAHYQGNT